jgi:PAS domain S-box-containing protein
MVEARRSVGGGVFQDVIPPPLVWAIDHITQGTETEADLRASEKYYRSLFESSHDPGLVLTPDEIVADVNDAACQVYGIPREEFIGLDMKTISVDVESGRGQMARVLRGENVHFESWQRRRDGSLLQLDIRATAIPFEHAIGVLSLNRDVTEERRREAALAESEERYRKLFESAPVGICRVAANGKLLAVNDALVGLVGYRQRDELMSLPSIDTLFVDDGARRQIARDLIRRGVSVRESRLRRPDGGITYVEIQARVAVDVVEAFATDITARKEAEAERERLAAEVYLLVHSAYEGICATDAEGRCTLVNAAAARMFGFDPADMQGRSLHELTHHSYAHGSPYPSERCAIVNVAVTGQSARTEDVLWRSNGEPFHAEILSSPIVVDGTVRGTVSSFLDITDRLATAKRLEVAERVAGLGRVARAVAHEFNNVLMAIMPVCDILERRVTDPKLTRLLAGMKTSVTRGKRISAEMLRFSRSAEPSLERVEVAPYLRTVSEMLATNVGRDIELVLNVHDESLSVLADAAQLREVFTNLAVNAREAMPDGGTLTIAAVRQYRGARNDVVHFEVADTGVGMTPEVRERVFEPLFTTKPAATGLGLPLVSRIVEDHRGSIYIDSAPGRGTAVHFFLAAAPPPPPDGQTEPEGIPVRAN